MRHASPLWAQCAATFQMASPRIPSAPRCKIQSRSLSGPSNLDEVILAAPLFTSTHSAACPLSRIAKVHPPVVSTELGCHHAAPKQLGQVGVVLEPESMFLRVLVITRQN